MVQPSSSARRYSGPQTITAYFTSATAIYPGDEVRIAGVKVGTIASIEPVGTQAKMTLDVDRGMRVPADAKAVIVAQNLVAARYVQLTPAYESGPAMSDGAVIPIERTAVPVEWDEVKEQLMRLATELGPDSGMSTGSVGRFIDSAANAMDGNGDKLRQTLAQLSGVGRILADGSGNIVDTIENLQTFVTALRDSNDQIVQFQDRFATFSSVVDDSRSDLDAALKNLSDAVGETTRFIAGTRDKTAEQIQRLANVTQNLCRPPHGPGERPARRAARDRQRLQHVRPAHRCRGGVFVFNNFSNPVWFICGMIGALENVTAPETAQAVCAVPRPGAATANFNNLPFPVNPFLTSNPPPDMLLYTEPGLMPGAAGQPRPPERAARGVGVHRADGDVPPPPGLWAATRTAAGPPPPAAAPPRQRRPCRTCCCPPRDRRPAMPTPPPRDGTPP